MKLPMKRRKPPTQMMKHQMMNILLKPASQEHPHGFKLITREGSRRRGITFLPTAAAAVAAARGKNEISDTSNFAVGHHTQAKSCHVLPGSAVRGKSKASGKASAETSVLHSANRGRVQSGHIESEGSGVNAFQQAAKSVKSSKMTDAAL